MNKQLLLFETEKRQGNTHGGQWTVEKLQALLSYSEQWFFVMNSKKNRENKFKKIYYDLFAGSDDAETRKGVLYSSWIKMLEQDFDYYYLGEIKENNFTVLENRVNEHHKRDKVKCIKGDSNKEFLPHFRKLSNPFHNQKYWNHRGLAFIDPFGLNITYELLTAIARTKKIDVIFALNIDFLKRRIPIIISDMKEADNKTIAEFFGNNNWHKDFYVDGQCNLTLDEKIKIVFNHFKTIFCYVPDITIELARTSKNHEMFRLIFCMAYSGKAAQNLMNKFVNAIDKDLRKPQSRTRSQAVHKATD